MSGGSVKIKLTDFMGMISRFGGEIKRRLLYTTRHTDTGIVVGVAYHSTRREVAL